MLAIRNSKPKIWKKTFNKRDIVEPPYIKNNESKQLFKQHDEYRFQNDVPVLKFVIADYRCGNL